MDLISHQIPTGQVPGAYASGRQRRHGRHCNQNRVLYTCGRYEPRRLDKPYLVREKIGDQLAVFIPASCLHLLVCLAPIHPGPSRMSHSADIPVTIFDRINARV